jgi:hypothetical protein
MNLNRIGNQTFYEILALEFVKNIDAFSLDQKAKMLAWIAECDLEASNMIRSAHAVTSSTLEALVLGDEMPLGIYSAEQQKFIRAA